LFALKRRIFLKIKEANGGILNFVYWLKKPAVVKGKEINTIKKFLSQEFDDVQISNILLP
jgi:hypothetical protein